MAIIKNDWDGLLAEEFEKPYYRKLRQFLKDEYAAHTVYPEQWDIYQALRLTPYAQTKVVILGQDPYHGPGQAHGLSFSVKSGVDLPPSLQNIFKELSEDLGCPLPADGELTHWAMQGVLLLNTVLTVRRATPQSHQGQGWEQLTDRIIALLNQRTSPMVFILWGSHAQKKAALVDGTRHHIIRSPHPSPLSAYRGFFGSRPFSRANAFLEQTGQTVIDWARNQ